MIDRLPQSRVKLGISRSLYYDQVSKGLITKPVALGVRAVGWPSSEIDAIARARIAGKSDAEIRDLVMQLEAARKATASEVLRQSA